MERCNTPRQSVVAGRFYPDDAKSLREQAQMYLALQPQKKINLQGKDALAVMVPHAGYMFSGSIAGMTFGQVDLPDRLVVLGPNHTGKGHPLSVWGGGEWQTPLGGMGIDDETAMALVNSSADFSLDTAAHVQEHSLEVQVPFFQIKNPNALIVPVIVALAELAALRAAGEALACVVKTAAAKGRRILIVVSSDMSHFLPHEVTVERDAMALEALCSLDAEKLHAVVTENNITMCGIYPMVLALFALEKMGAANAHIIAYATSGETGRSFGASMDKVVGYAGVVITR